jgi:hypothetical protein
MKHFVRHINISDIHISIYKEPIDYVEELMDIIYYIDKIKDNLDILTIAGDLFDRVYPANHKAIQIAVEFIKILYNRAKIYDFKIFIVKGTQSHDSTQLDIFAPLEDNTNLFIIKDVTFYEYEGLLFRFIPEYYCNDYEELKEKALTTMADVTIYHGSIESAMPYAKAYKAETHKSAQILKDKDIIETTGLYTVCGHIHNRIVVADNIWYTGSYSSKSFTDAGQKKGFDDITIDLENGTYDCKFIENKKCRKYTIIDGTEICRQSIKKMKAFFNDLKLDKTDKDEIRIDVDTNRYSDEEYKNLSLIMSSYKGTFKFKIEREVKVSEVKSIEEDAEYVLSPTIPLTDKIQKTIEEIYDVNIDISRIKELLDIPEFEKPTISDN